MHSCPVCVLELRHMRQGEIKMDDPKVIVVVDDDEMIRKTFFLILHDKYKVYLAKNSQEALQRLDNSDVDLIIADLKLPHTSGVELISRYRNAGYKGEAILISAYLDQLEEYNLDHLSIAHFFTKPLDLTALDKSISCLLN